MAGNVKKSKAEIATIDVSLVTIETTSGEFGFDTSNKVAVEPQTEETDAVKLVIKGKDETIDKFQDDKKARKYVSLRSQSLFR